MNGNGDGDPAFEFDTHAPPSLVSLVPFSPSTPPSTRRLSSSFTVPGRLTPSAPRRPLAWISLQARIIGAEEASSARTIGGGRFSPEEAVAWELFSPIQRVLVVAVIAVAVSQSKKNREISKLQKSVRLRDQLLTSMQNKLDDLCKQVNNIQDQTEAGSGLGFFLCHQHGILSNDFGGNITTEVSKSEDIFKYKVQPSNEAEHEGQRMSEPDERRMSGLSDWASSSVTSSADIQLNTLPAEQDLFNIKKECEEKDATIEKLSTCLYSSDISSSKRISELEGIIRRKSKLITKLRRDMVVLEQKVVHLTRLRRPSFSDSNTGAMEHPFMAANVLYDMDSTTSPSSSDSDSFPKSRPQTPMAKFHGSPIPSSELSSMENQKSAPLNSAAKIHRTPSSREISKPTPAKASSSARLLEQLILSRPASPLTEDSMNQRNGTLKPKQLSESSSLRTRKQIPARPKDSAPLRKWV